MDKIDQKILAIIQEDISLPLTEVARRVGLSKTHAGTELKVWRKRELSLIR